jgi:hypothetical protein
VSTLYIHCLATVDVFQVEVIQLMFLPPVSFLGGHDLPRLYYYQTIVNARPVFTLQRSDPRVTWVMDPFGADSSTAPSAVAPSVSP